MFYIVKQDEDTGLFDVMRVVGTVKDRIGRYTDVDRAERIVAEETLKYERRGEADWD
jgi:hypothetical protein